MWSLLEYFGDTPAEAVAMVATCGAMGEGRTPAEVVDLLRFWMGRGFITTADVADGAALARDAFENGPNETTDEMARAVVVLSRVLR